MLPRLARGLLLVVVGAAAALCAAGCEKNCRPGTVFLDVDLGSSAGADALDIAITVVGGNQNNTVEHVPNGATHGGVEIDFPGGYPAGTTVDFTLRAMQGTTMLGMTSGSVVLANGCTHASVAFPGAMSGGTGGQRGGGGSSGQGGNTGLGGGSGSGLGGNAGLGGNTGLGGGNGSGGNTGLGGGNGSGGNTGLGGGNGSGGSPSGVVPLTPDAMGYVSGNVLGIMGPWFAFSDAISPNDGLSSDSPCVLAGHPVSACSKVLTPTPGTAFVPTNLASGMMCTTGVAAKAVDVVGQVGIPDYSNIYGGGIGMNFNELQGATNRAAFNFSAAHVVGISFDIDQVPSGGIRVELPTTSTVQSPAIYQPNAVANYISPLQTGHNQIRWNQAIYPDYVVNPPLFDPTQLLAVAFHVATSSVGPVSYAFCISNLSAIVGP